MKFPPVDSIYHAGEIYACLVKFTTTVCFVMLSFLSFAFFAGSMFFLFAAEAFVTFFFAFVFVFTFVFTSTFWTFCARVVTATATKNATKEFADCWTLIAHLWYLLLSAYVPTIKLVQLRNNCVLATVFLNHGSRNVVRQNTLVFYAL